MLVFNLIAYASFSLSNPLDGTRTVDSIFYHFVSVFVRLANALPSPFFRCSIMMSLFFLFFIHVPFLTDRSRPACSTLPCTHIPPFLFLQGTSVVDLNTTGGRYVCLPTSVVCRLPFLLLLLHTRDRVTIDRADKSDA